MKLLTYLLTYLRRRAAPRAKAEGTFSRTLPALKLAAAAMGISTTGTVFNLKMRVARGLGFLQLASAMRHDGDDEMNDATN